MSLPVRGAWIEMVFALCKDLQLASLPVRGAWIEIAINGTSDYPTDVAPRAGSVD